MARNASPIRVTGMMNGRLVDAFAFAISASGIQLVAARSAAVGARISIVALVDGDLVAAQGAVRASVLDANGRHLLDVGLESFEGDGRAVLAAHAAA